MGLLAHLKTASHHSPWLFHTGSKNETAVAVQEISSVVQMKYQHMAEQNGGASAPQEATDQATGASVSQEGAHGAEKGLFGSADSHSLSDAAKELPIAVGSAAAAVTGAPAFFASAVRETARRDPEAECMRMPGEAVHDSASKDSQPGLSSACTLNSGFAQVSALSCSQDSAASVICAGAVL